MFSGLMTSVAMCRQQKYLEPEKIMKGVMDPPKRFKKRVDRRSMGNYDYVLTESNTNPESARDPETEYREASQAGGETVMQYKSDGTYRYKPLLPGDGKDGVIAPWSSSSWVDEEVDGLVRDWDRGGLGEHDIQVHRAEDLLQGVEGEPTQFALDEIGAVLHDGLELNVPVPALPSRDEMQHVRALGCLPVLPAGSAGQGDAESGEEWEVCGLVPHSEEPREEVDLAGHCGNGQ